MGRERNTGQMLFHFIAPWHIASVEPPSGLSSITLANPPPEDLRALTDLRQEKLRYWKYSYGIEKLDLVCPSQLGHCRFVTDEREIHLLLGDKPFRVGQIYCSQNSGNDSAALYVGVALYTGNRPCCDPALAQFYPSPAADREVKKEKTQKKKKMS